MRTVLWILLGALIMFVILKMLSKKTVSSAEWINFKELAKTQQAANLVRTNEFRELVKTPQFKNMLTSLASDQLAVISKTLIG